MKYFLIKCLIIYTVIWSVIIRIQYDQHDPLEFGGGCKSACENGNVPFWNGSITGNKLYELNMTGRYLMEIRKKIS
jgi:hypothetical protein